jgi:hypothetical protein
VDAKEEQERSVDSVVVGEAVGEAPRVDPKAIREVIGEALAWTR